MGGFFNSLLRFDGQVSTVERQPDAGANVTRESAVWLRLPGVVTSNRQSTIMFGLGEKGGYVDLRVYDIRGMLVGTLVSEVVGSGHHSVTWDQRDTRGSRVASGIYLVRLSAGGVVRTGKVMILR